MRFAALALSSLLMAATAVDAFVASRTASTMTNNNAAADASGSRKWSSRAVPIPVDCCNRARISATLLAAAAIENDDEKEDDCGCATVITTTYSGKPSDMALSQVNPRQALGRASVVNLKGDKTTMDELLFSSKTSLVVFLRSLG